MESKANQAIKAPTNLANMAATSAKSATSTKTEKTFTALDCLRSTSFQNQLKNALPKFFDTDRFIRSAINEFRLSKSLQECSVPSVLGFFMQAATLGLEPASTLGQCYPVPFNNKNTGQKECQFIVGYRGMAALARRSGEVSSIDAQIVHEKDEFTLEYGVEPKLIHRPYLDGDPGMMRGAYVFVRFRDGSYQYKFMPKYEIDAHRTRSKADKAGFSPWQSDYDEMAKKTVFRSLFKWLPIVIEEAAMTQADGSVARLDVNTGEVDIEPIVAEFTVSEPENDDVVPNPEL